MDAKILIIPDVHGRDFWKDAVKGREDWNIVFLGDYTDPYEGYEDITKEQCFNSLNEIIAFKKEHKDNVTLLIGNHDLSYLDSRMPKCRTDRARYYDIFNIFKENLDLFDLCHEVNINGIRYIFSHSGIIPEWLRKHEEEPISLDNVVQFLNDKFHNDLEDCITWLLDISYFRGGASEFGSCVWGDSRELYYYYKGLEHYEVIPDSYQIVGHTLQYNPLITDNFACLDCKKAFILYNNGDIKEVENE